MKEQYKGFIMKKFILLVVFSAFAYASSAQTIVSRVCSECHGIKMDESGMGVSQPPNSLSQGQIYEALKGYKKGRRSEYGMGSTMTEKVSGYSYATLEELSKYIATLR